MAGVLDVLPAVKDLMGGREGALLAKQTAPSRLLEPTAVLAPQKGMIHPSFRRYRALQPGPLRSPLPLRYARRMNGGRSGRRNGCLLRRGSKKGIGEEVSGVIGADGSAWARRRRAGKASTPPSE